MTLPTFLDALTGLRAARWVRESTREQYDTFGPDAQREQQDRAIERFGLVDTGLSWTVAHSGRTVASTDQFRQMLAGAGRDYDVLVVGYVSRFARDLRTAVNARHDLHAAGAAILFCDERLLTSDEDAWEQFAREAVEAEAYSRRLGRRIKEGYAAKFRRHADQAGTPPVGFHRVNGLVEPNPLTIGKVVTIFERYAQGGTPMTVLEAEYGIPAPALREILRNPMYNGWATRKGERVPAAWRSAPPVSDDLWARVQLVRGRRVTGGGGAHAVHAHLLRKIAWCVTCGGRVKADGARRYRHIACGDGGVFPKRTLEAPIVAQVSGMRLSPDHFASLRQTATRPVTQPTGSLRRKQLEKQLTERAMAHARGELDTPTYLADHERINTEIQALAEAPPAAPLADADEVLAYVADIAEAWRWADEEARQALVAAIYSRVLVRAGMVEEIELTPDAWRHAMALAMPETVVALARPAGAKRASATVRIKIAGRAALIAQLRRSA